MPGAAHPGNTRLHAAFRFQPPQMNLTLLPRPIHFRYPLRNRLEFGPGEIIQQHDHRLVINMPRNETCGAEFRVERPFRAASAPAQR